MVGVLRTDPKDTSKVQEYTLPPEDAESTSSQNNDFVFLTLLLIAAYAIITKSRFAVWVVAFGSFSNWALSPSATPNNSSKTPLLFLTIPGMIVIYLTSPSLKPNAIAKT